MAPTNRDRIKRTLLIGFVAVSVVLIGMIWADGLVADQPVTPSYYRDTFQVDPQIYVTLTAEAIEYENLYNGTPPPVEEEHHGTGGGRGHTVVTPTLVDTATP